jgi:hypothetical protein
MEGLEAEHVVATVPAPSAPIAPAVSTFSWLLATAAILMILGAAGCAIAKMVSGATSAADYADCGKTALLGLGILSPGVAAFRGGPFARNTKDVVVPKSEIV